jgi:hypothetical protein
MTRNNGETEIYLGSNRRVTTMVLEQTTSKSWEMRIEKITRSKQKPSNF